MRNPLSLLWWLFLLACAQAAALVLDSLHHLPWGRAALWILKSGYLVFAGILFFRYLSFRSQKSFEAMIDSYNRLSDTPLGPLDEPRGAVYKYLTYLSLIALAAANLLMLPAWSAKAMRATILLEAGVWGLMLLWITRAHWLKALGLRERVKEYLDNARSRMRSEAPALTRENPAVEKWPFLLIGGLALGVTLAVSAWRWTRAPLAYRVDSLKGCLGETYREAAETYYHHGRLDATVVASHCLAGPRAELDISVGMDGAAPKITAAETPASDFFGNGKGGDEGLELGTSGRFRAITP